jgi:hypothetical protein
MAGSTSKVASDIKKAMEHSEKWETKKTSIKGVYLVRMPGEVLFIRLWFVPPGKEPPNPKNQRGFYFADSEAVKAARKAFNDDRLDPLIAAVEKVNAPVRRKSRADEVFKL